VSGVVEAVCVVHAVRPDPGGDTGTTAIDKRPVGGRVSVTPGGVEGDHVEDTDNHGGRDQAVYAYASEDRLWWAEQLGRALEPGAFGENLALRGIDVTGAVIGQTWRVGTALLQVTSPRIPCATFQRWTGEQHWVRRFTEAGVPGAYLRVIEPGEVGPGDPVEVVDTPAHGVTVGQVFAGRRGDRAALERLLADGDDLQPTMVEGIRRELAVGG